MMRSIPTHRDDDDRAPGTVMRWIVAAIMVAGMHAGTVMLVSGWGKSQPQPDEPPAAMLVDLMPVIATPQRSLDNAPPGPVTNETSPAQEQAQTAITPPLPAAKEPLLPAKPETAPKPKSKPASDRTLSERTSAPTRLRAEKNAPSAAPAPGSAVTPSVVPPSWRSALMAHLNKHKRYPAAARQRGETGVARLLFTMDRSGRVLSYRLLAGTGVSLLDQETLAMIQRASPLPPLPPEIHGDRLTLTVPVRFSLQ